MHLRGIGYAIIASLIFGLGAVLVRLIGQEIDATVAALLNLSIGGLLVSLVVIVRGAPLFKSLRGFKRRDWLDLFLLSCPGTALPLLVIVAGFARTSALVGGFLLQFNGIAGIFFAFLLLRERIGLKQGIGTLLLLSGGVLVVLKGTQAISPGSGLGDLLILLGSLGIGFGIIPAKRLSTRIDTMPLVAIRLLLGAATLLPILAVQLIVNGIHSVQWQPSLTTLWVVLPIYIVGNFCLAYIVQQEGLRFIQAWEMSAITQTVPLFATIFALLILHDSMTVIQALGGLLAILGGLIVSISPTTTPRTPHPRTPTRGVPTLRDGPTAPHS
ncbi:MAG: DMT family transporter [Ktedonobacteraceae bacterium]